MLISEFSNRENILAYVAKELRNIGVKIRHEKTKSVHPNKRKNKKIFKTSLHILDLDDAVLSNGSVVQVPKFVLSACRRIQAESTAIGIFRKTGSVKKQVEIQQFLELGGSIDKSHNVIDVANLLKKFFRELPEPLIPLGAIQESLLRCLLSSSYEKKIDALMLTCLLLPPITINTLAFFLQFLQVIIQQANVNLMSADNLVKILTPSLMPTPVNAPENRLQSHFKVVELLMENANLIGVVPDRIMRDLNIVPQMPALTPDEHKKKKQRRSGSVTRMLTGFKKIVGAIGSSESLDKSNDTLDEISTPLVTKSSKKRRFEKLENAFSHKKPLMMTLTSLPEIDDSPTKERNSLGEPLTPEIQPVSTLSRRRWSYGAVKKKKSQIPDQVDSTATILNDTAPDSVAMTNDSDYVKVSKSEYEAFKTRLSTIETQISQEFNAIKLDSVKAEMLGSSDIPVMSGLQKVQNKFNQTMQEVGELDAERNTHKLAKRLSRDLQIRENPVIRSPSARKIGSLRRRQSMQSTQTKLTRNMSWHLGPTINAPIPVVKKIDDSTFMGTSSFYPKSNLKRSRPVQTGLNVQQTARPLPALPPSPSPHKLSKTEKKSFDNHLQAEKEPVMTPVKSLSTESDMWTPAKEFFNVFSNDHREIEMPHVDGTLFKTPVRPKPLTIKSTMKGDNDFTKTPMLPPRSTPSSTRKCAVTPIRPMDSSMLKSPFSTPSLQESQGRASIIQIRNQNAGMVAQKAKLFDGMSVDLLRSSEQPPIRIPRVVINRKLENVKQMGFDELPSKFGNQKLPPRSPRRSSRSPGVNRRQMIRATTQSPVLKTIKENDNHKKLLKPEILKEISTSSSKVKLTDSDRKPLSQNNTPKRGNSAKKRTPRHKTPTKSPRFSQRIRNSPLVFD